MVFFLASWFLGVEVSWFFGLLVSRFLGFLVSEVLGFLVSKIQKTARCLKYIRAIWPKFHFMFLDRYWSHIQDAQEFIKRRFSVFLYASFSTYRNMSIFKIVRFLQTIFPQNDLVFSRINYSILVSPTLKIHVSGSHDHVGEVPVPNEAEQFYGACAPHFS